VPPIEVLIEPWTADVVWQEEVGRCDVCGHDTHIRQAGLEAVARCLLCAVLAPYGQVSYQGLPAAAEELLDDRYYLILAEETRDDRSSLLGRPYRAEWRALVRRAEGKVGWTRRVLARWLRLPVIPTRVLRPRPLPERLRSHWDASRALQTGLLPIFTSLSPPHRVLVGLAGLPEEADLEAFIAAYALRESTFLLELRVLDGEVPEERLIDLLYWGSDGRAIVPAEIRPARLAVEVLQGEELDLLRQAVRTGRDTARVLVRLALDRGASDIHVEPLGDVTRVRLRIGGTLQTVARLNPDDWEAIALAVKSVAGIRTERALAEQKGAFTVRDEKTGRTTDCRVSIIPAVVPGARGDVGEFVEIRLLEKGVVDHPLLQIGLVGKAYALLQGAVQAGARGTWGLVILSGPTGSGKTTTLYATLRQLDLDHLNVCAVEDPVEYHLPGIKQVSVLPTFSFSAAIRAFLRQDPDIILVGEVRDRETARAALEAALTGHMVLTTVHANTAFQVIRRLVDLLTDPMETRASVFATVLAALRLVSTQRLLRRPCPNCSRRVKLPPIAQKDGYEWGYAGEGCSTCRHTGYGDRVPVFEVAAFDEGTQEDALRLSLDTIETELRRLCEMQGTYVSMLDDALWKATRRLLDARCLELVGGPLWALSVPS